MNLENIKLEHSPLTDLIYLYRHVKGRVLEKREAEADVMSVLVSHMMHGSPKGSRKTITLNGRSYIVTVTPGKTE